MIGCHQSLRSTSAEVTAMDTTTETSYQVPVATRSTSAEVTAMDTHSL